MIAMIVMMAMIQRTKNIQKHFMIKMIVMLTMRTIALAIKMEGRTMRMRITVTMTITTTSQWSVVIMSFESRALETSKWCQMMWRIFFPSNDADTRG